MTTIKTPGSGNKSKTSFNPLANITPAKSSTTKSTPARTASQVSAINAGRAAAPTTTKLYSGPLIDPVTGASGVADYAASIANNNNPPGSPYVAPAPDAAYATPDTSIETLTKTPEYLARERAIQAAMNQFTAGQATDLARYNEDYGRSLSELGYNATTGFDRGNLLSSGQRATTSGKAYNALGDDFAARGMLQSGAYQARQGVLGTQLEDQRQALDRAKLRFNEDQNKALLAQQAQNEQQRQAALEAARQSILNSMVV